MSHLNPALDCPLCPRLCAFRRDNKIKFSTYHNAPVPSFGSFDAEFLVVGLAPGLHGANQTGRPFTGDFAGEILYSALQKAGFAKGVYDPTKFSSPCKGEDQGGGLSTQSRNSQKSLHHNPHPTLPLAGGGKKGDSFTLINTRITNAVRCVPQENKPETSEIKACNNFLKNEIAAMPNLKVILSLGLVSHQAVLTACGLKKSAFKFMHGAQHKIRHPRHPYLTNIDGELKDSRMRGNDVITHISSYHTSRYNINVGTLTQEMFDEVILKAKDLL